MATNQIVPSGISGAIVGGYYGRLWGDRSKGQRLAQRGPQGLGVGRGGGEGEGGGARIERRLGRVRDGAGGELAAVGRTADSLPLRRGLGTHRAARGQLQEHCQPILPSMAILHLVIDIRKNVQIKGSPEVARPV